MSDFSKALSTKHRETATLEASYKTDPKSECIPKTFHLLADLVDEAVQQKAFSVNIDCSKQVPKSLCITASGAEFSQEQFHQLVQRWSRNRDVRANLAHWLLFLLVKENDCVVGFAQPGHSPECIVTSLGSPDMERVKMLTSLSDAAFDELFDELKRKKSLTLEVILGNCKRLTVQQDNDMMFNVHDASLVAWRITSLRVFLSIAYLAPRASLFFKQILVTTAPVHRSMRGIERHECRSRNLTTSYFVGLHPDKRTHGILLYQENRLIQAVLGDAHNPFPMHLTAVAVLTEFPLAMERRSFQPSDDFTGIIRSITGRIRHFWLRQSHITQRTGQISPDDYWALCSRCHKWRRVVQIDIDARWHCRMKQVDCNVHEDSRVAIRNDRHPRGESISSVTRLQHRTVSKQSPLEKLESLLKAKRPETLPRTPAARKTPGRPRRPIVESDDSTSSSDEEGAQASPFERTADSQREVRRLNRPVVFGPTASPASERSCAATPPSRKRKYSPRCSSSGTLEQVVQAEPIQDEPTPPPPPPPPPRQSASKRNHGGSSARATGVESTMLPPKSSEKTNRIQTDEEASAARHVVEVLSTEVQTEHSSVYLENVRLNRCISELETEITTESASGVQELLRLTMELTQLEALVKLERERSEMASERLVELELANELAGSLEREIREVELNNQLMQETNRTIATELHSMQASLAGYQHSLCNYLWSIGDDDDVKRRVTPENVEQIIDHILNQIGAE